jgi:hypothetical protein
MNYLGMPIINNFLMLFFSFLNIFILFYYNAKIKFNFKQLDKNSNLMFMAFLSFGLSMVLFYIIGMKKIDGFFLEKTIFNMFATSNLFVLLINMIFLCLVIFVTKNDLNITHRLKKKCMMLINFYVLLYISYFAISFFLLLIGFKFDKNKAFSMVIEKIFEMKIENYSILTQYETVNIIFKYVYYIYTNSIYVFMLLFLSSLIMRRRSIFFMSGGFMYLFNNYKIYGNYKKLKIMLYRANYFDNEEFKKSEKKRLKKLLKRGIVSIERPIPKPRQIINDTNIFVKNEKEKERKRNQFFLAKKINLFYFLNKKFYFFVKKNSVNFLLAIFFLKMAFTFFIMSLSFFGIIHFDDELRFYKSNTLIIFCIIVIFMLFDNKIFSQKFEKNSFNVFFCFLIMLITIQNMLYSISNVPLLSYVILFFIYKIKDILYNNNFKRNKYIFIMFGIYFVYEVFAKIVSQSEDLLVHQSLYFFILVTLVFDIEKFMKWLTAKK